MFVSLLVILLEVPHLNHTLALSMCRCYIALILESTLRHGQPFLIIFWSTGSFVDSEFPAAPESIGGVTGDNANPNVGKYLQERQREQCAVALSWGKKLFQRVFWLCLGVFLTKDIFSQSPDNFRSEQLITPREGQHLNRVDEIFAQQLQDMLKLVVPGWVRPVEMCLGACMLHDVATHMVEGIAHICVSWCL